MESLPPPPLPLCSTREKAGNLCISCLVWWLGSSRECWAILVLCILYTAELPCSSLSSSSILQTILHLTHSTTPLFLCLIWENQHLNLQRADIEIKMLCLYQYAQCEEYFKDLKGIMYIIMSSQTCLIFFIL